MFVSGRSKDWLIRERARSRYRGRTATPNLRDFFQNYEGNAAQNPRDTSSLIKRIVRAGWFKFCTCPPGVEKKSPRFSLHFSLRLPLPPLFSLRCMQGWDSPAAPFLSRGHRGLPYRRTVQEFPATPRHLRAIQLPGGSGQHVFSTRLPAMTARP